MEEMLINNALPQSEQLNSVIRLRWSSSQQIEQCVPDGMWLRSPSREQCWILGGGFAQNLDQLVSIGRRENAMVFPARHGWHSGPVFELWYRLLNVDQEQQFVWCLDCWLLL